MKISELTGAALDWAVAKCLGLNVVVQSGVCHDAELVELGADGDTRFSPSTDRSQGGPIIERERLSFEWIDSGRWLCGWHSGQTPLIAAMRCYVASKLGDEVDVPEELLP